jgi:integrase
MPRRREPPRLYFREDEQVWIIRDGPRSVRTGCGPDDSRRAEEELAKYLAEKFTPAVREHSPARLSVPEVLTAYGREHGPSTKDPARIGYAIDALMVYWHDKTLMEIRGATCREYIEHRRAMRRANMAGARTDARRRRTVSDGTIRRELGVLSAAIDHWHREHGPLDTVPVVTFPPKPDAKPHWLTQDEFARLLLGALGWYQVSWSDLPTRDVSRVWKRDREAICRHLCRFLIVGRYTATRPGAILALKWMPNTTGGWPDEDAEIMHRKGEQHAESNKRQGIVRLGRAALAHFRRWRGIDDRIRDALAQATGKPVTSHMNVVSWGGKEIGDIGRSFSRALDYAGLPSTYTPHILRHTRVTWWVQAGLSLEEVAEAADMTVQTIEDVYWHHSPHFQKRAAEA